MQMRPCMLETEGNEEKEDESEFDVWGYMEIIWLFTASGVRHTFTNEIAGTEM